MGYFVFELVLASARVLACQTGNAVDFVALPDGVTSDQVVGVRPGQGRGREPDCRERRYAWSLYRDATRPDLPLYLPRLGSGVGPSRESTGGRSKSSL